MLFWKNKPIENNFFTLSDGREIPVVAEARRGLRNITLRPRTIPKDEIRISIPRMTPVSTAMRFLESKRAWVEKIFARAPIKTKIKSGDTIEFLGRCAKIVHNPTGRAGVYIEKIDTFQQDNISLIVCGSADMLERRVRDFIKSEFLAAVKRIIKTTPPEFYPKRIRITDTTSRWGSCSSTGTMSFSYRLAFAPPDIMRYVIMHELAHTKHMDHSPAFWATVAQLYGDGVGRAKLWLSKNSAALHKYF